jgi:hypothetical protein
MIALLSNASPVVPMEVIKAALPIGIGLASAAFLTMKIASSSSYGQDKVIKKPIDGNRGESCGEQTICLSSVAFPAKSHE